MQETWRAIRGYEGLYEVSNKGRVRGLYHRFGKRSEPKILSVRKDGKGYHQVRLYGRDGTSSYPKVHRLVAEAFIPNPLGLPQVNHKWEDKDRNGVEDLEWCTGQYNVEYSHAKTYKFVSPSGEVVEIFNLQKFCRDNNLTSANMNKVYKGERKQHKGWTKYNGDNQ